MDNTAKEQMNKIPANLVLAGSYFMLIHEGDYPDVTFGFTNASDIQETIDRLKKYVDDNNVEVLNRASFKLFNEIEMVEESTPINENKNFIKDPMLLEMEMFNVKRRDIMSFADFTKAPENASKLIKGKGDLAKNEKGYLKEYTRKIQRDPIFGHPVFDSTYRVVDISQGKKVDVPYLEALPFGAHGAPQKAETKPKVKAKVKVKSKAKPKAKAKAKPKAKAKARKKK